MNKNYYKDGQCSEELDFSRILHREDGPARIHLSGMIEYYINGLRHKEDGPAVIWPDGAADYYLYGELHNEKGPAVILMDGTKYYALGGIRYSENEYRRIVAEVASMPLELRLVDPREWVRNKRD